MIITALQIMPHGNIPIKTNTSTLDEMTRELPQGFYTTFSTLAHGTRVTGLQAHLDRLYVPAKEMKLHPAVDEQTLREQIAQIVKGNLPRESRVRLILTKDSAEIFVGVQPFMPLPELIYGNGVHVITSTTARHDPRIKDTGFIPDSVTQRKLLNKDVFEVLLTKNGKILEGMTSNFYAIQGKTLVTAQSGILLGVTRRVILRLARGQGMSIEYRAPEINEKLNEAFLTSSSRGVVPIISIDHKSVGQGRAGEWTEILMKAFWEYVEEKSSWIVE